MSLLDVVLWGTVEAPRAHVRRYVRGLGAAALAGFALVALATSVVPPSSLDWAVYEWVFAGLLFVAPPVVAAVSTLRGGGLVAALAIGLVPAVAFAVLGTALQLLGTPIGDAPAAVLATAFAVFGVAGAGAGAGVGAAARVALDRYRGE